TARSTTDIYPLSLHDALPILDIQRGILIMNSNRLPYTEHVYTRETMDELGVVSIFRGKSETPGYMAQRGSKYGARKEPWMSVLRSEEHTSVLQSRENLVCRLL